MARHMSVGHLPDHPRIRGEHAGAIMWGRQQTGSSPHTRGARVHVFDDGICRGIIPAYAGSTKVRIKQFRVCGDHPRIRGEHVAWHLQESSQLGSSPHTRGALPRGRDPHFRRGIIPAYAGSTPSSPARSRKRKDHPRIRGEHTLSEHSRTLVSGSSPHTRGAPRWESAMPRKARIIPAYAGSTSRRSWPTSPSADHPRIRGEHRLDIPWPQAMQGSSPHTRGAQIHARAGHRFVSDHPRIRGEHSSRKMTQASRAGSSPHTRGAPADGDVQPVFPGIIPAYAGSTSTASNKSSRPRDHPRIRGEHSPCLRARTIATGSSPHTRGARDEAHCWVRVGWIIPAYAGSTRTAAWCSRRAGDHPRIRGEHDRYGVTCPISFGSSPHTRGAQFQHHTSKS